MKKKTSNKVVWSGMPNSEAQMKEIKGAVESCSEYLSEIDNANMSIKEVFEEMNAKYGIPKRVFNSLCKFNHYGNYDEAFSKNQEVQDAWDAFVKNN